MAAGGETEKEGTTQWGRFDVGEGSEIWHRRRERRR